MKRALLLLIALSLAFGQLLGCAPEPEVDWTEGFGQKRRGMEPTEHEGRYIRFSEDDPEEKN